jgi:dGTPase
VIEVEAAGFEVLGWLAGSLRHHRQRPRRSRGPAASPKSRMLIHLIPESVRRTGTLPGCRSLSPGLAITDFVSGMTDSYAVALFKKITGISLPTG